MGAFDLQSFPAVIVRPRLAVAVVLAAELQFEVVAIELLHLAGGDGKLNALDAHRVGEVAGPIPGDVEDGKVLLNIVAEGPLCRDDDRGLRWTGRVCRTRRR